MADTVALGPQSGSDPSGGASTKDLSVPLRTRIIDWLQFVPALAVNLIVTILVAAIVILLTRKLLREPVIIEEVSLPHSMITQGFSGAVTAQRLSDAISETQTR